MEKTISRLRVLTVMPAQVGKKPGVVNHSDVDEV
jgi:hypothetical protein